MTSLADAKKQLRSQARRRRRELVEGCDPAEMTALPADRQAASLAVAQAAAPLLGGPGRGCIAAYEAMPSEPPTDALIAAALHAGIHVLVPELLPDQDLDWRQVRGPEPDDCGPVLSRGPVLGRGAVRRAGVVFVPALLVDRAGRRLGQGGGSYDRALPRCAPGVLIVAVVHDAEIVDGPLPTADHDARVGAVITPGGGLVLLG